MNPSGNLGAYVASFAFAICLLVANPLSAATPHPFHISVAEVELNEETKRLEVSLKVHASDLERSLELMHGKTVDVEKDAIDKQVENFIDQFFYLLPASTAMELEKRASSEQEPVEPKEFPRTECRYVGMELETSWMWLYFELDMPETKEPLAIVDAVFLDRIDKQINTVTFRVDNKRHALKLTKKQPWAKTPWLDEALK